MILTPNEIRELIFNTIIQCPIDTFDEWIGIKRDDNTSKYTYSVVVTDENHFEIDVRYDGGRVLVIGYEVFIPMKAVIPMHRITFDVVREFFGSTYFMHYDGIRITHDTGSLSIDQETKIAASNIPQLHDLVCKIFDVLRDVSEHKSKLMHDALVKKSIPGLTTKEVFTLDEDFFKSGDIYLLHISPEFHGDILNGAALAPDAHLPSKVYAICTDTKGGTAIEFLFRPEEPLVGIRDLVYIRIRAEDIENGLIKVTRKLCNEALIQDALIQDKEFNRYEG